MAEQKKKTVLKETKKRTVKAESLPQESKDLSLAIYDLKGAEEKKITLPAEIFEVKGTDALLTQYVRVFQVNQKQGNANAKTRSEVNGTTKKVYRQKGTGNARHGAVKAPIFVGGGVQGGPLTHNPSLRMNKKQKKKALFAALTQSYNSGNLMGITDGILDIQPKTKEVSTALKNLKLEGQKVLIVIPHKATNTLQLASRNIKSVNLVYADMINPYILLDHKKVLIAESGLQIIKEHFLKDNASK